MRAITTTLILAALVLAGCGNKDEDKDPKQTPKADKPSGSGQASCIVGAWTLDVAAYAAESEAFLTGLKLPIQDFAMTGDGSMDVTAEGLIKGEISLNSTGVMVPNGEVRVPFNTPSAYAFSGGWEPADEGQVRLKNWTSTATAPPASTGAPAVPTLDFDEKKATIACSADTLVISEPGAPLKATWRR